MSRRPVTLDLDQELARMAPGGRLWSESPVRRPWPRVRQAGIPVPAPANPWPTTAPFTAAVASTATSRTWTYDPHPQTITRIRCALSHTGTVGTFYAVADGVTSTTGTLPDSPGGGSFLLTLTPSVPGLKTVVLNWSPAGALNLAAAMSIQPEWT